MGARFLADETREATLQREESRFIDRILLE